MFGKLVLRKFLIKKHPIGKDSKAKIIKGKINIYFDTITFRSKTKKLFFSKHGYKLNLKNPKSFNEKIIWKKFFERDPLLVLTSDKYRVRNYIKEKLGKNKSDKYLIPLLFVGNNPKDIHFKDLPDEYILKPNNSAGCYIITEVIENKKQYTVMDHPNIYRLKNSDSIKKNIIYFCEKWLSITYGENEFQKKEWAYTQIKPLILIEKLLKDVNGNIPNDYKFFMFHGQCKMISFCSNRFTNLGFTYYDSNWKLLPIIRGKAGTKTEKPKVLNEMLIIAEILSKDFSFVRIDLYLVGDNIFVGEITHYPSSGYLKITPTEYDFLLGSYWNLK